MCMWAWPSLIRKFSYPTRFSDWRVHSCSDNRGSTVVQFGFILTRVMVLELCVTTQQLLKRLRLQLTALTFIATCYRYRNGIATQCIFS